MTNSDFFDGVYEPGFDARSHYGEWADRYDDALEEQGYAQPRRCAEMADRLAPAGATVLDVGCGTGLSGVALREAGFEVVDGCDLSPEMLEIAGERGVYRRTFEADLNSPPIDARDGEYGLVTAAGVFGTGHVESDAVDELVRITRVGGALVLGVNDHYWNSGELAEKLDSLAATGGIDLLAPEMGDHLPGIDLVGWVIGFRRLA